MLAAYAYVIELVCGFVVLYWLGVAIHGALEGRHLRNPWRR